MDSLLLTRILAACATLIGVVIFFFIVDHFARRKAMQDLKAMGLPQQHARAQGAAHKADRSHDRK